MPTLPSQSLPRPLLLALGGLVAGVLLASPLPALSPIWLLPTSVLWVLAYWPRRASVAVRALMPILFFCLCGILRTQAAASPAPDDVSRWARDIPLLVRGRIVSEVEAVSPQTQTFTLEADKVDDYRLTQAAGGKLRVTARRGAMPVVFGDVVWVRGVIEHPLPATNPGGFDYAAYLRRRGIFATLHARFAGDVRGISQTGDVSLINRLVLFLRERLRRTVAVHLPRRDAVLLSGLLIGDRQTLDAETQDAFTRTGTVHLLCVSGAHLWLILWIVQCLLGTFLPRFAVNSAAIPLLWLYALVAGGSPAVLRSAFMLTLFLLAPLVGRTADRFMALAFAAWLILLWEPLALYDPGTQLSFATVGMLCLWMPPLEKRWFPWIPGNNLLQNELRRMVLIFVAGGVALASSAPLIAFHFHLLTPVSLLVNVPMSLLSALLLSSGLGAVLFSLLPDFLAGILWAILGLGVQMLRFMAVTFAHAPYAAFAVPEPTMPLLIGYYTCAGIGGFLFRRHVLQRTIFAPAPADFAVDSD